MTQPTIDATANQRSLTLFKANKQVNEIAPMTSYPFMNNLIH